MPDPTAVDPMQIGWYEAAAALEAEAETRKRIAGELDRVAADPDLIAGWLQRHDLIRTMATPQAILRAVAADIRRGHIHGRRERWVVDGLVGSWVCAEPMPDLPDGICGMPVEDVPCTVHHPETAGSPPADTWRPARPGDTPGELIPETGPQYPLHLTASDDGSRPRIGIESLRRHTAARILDQLARATDPIAPIDLAARSRATYFHTGKILTAAAHHGLAVRVTPPDGSRPGLWTITPAGRDHVTRISEGARR